MARRRLGDAVREGTDEKKPRAEPRLFDRGREARRLQGANVRCLQALLALLDFEFDALILGQGLETIALNVAEVGEQVGTASVLRNEAIALGFVEPLHGTGLGRHGRIPIYLSKKEEQSAAVPAHAAHSSNEKGISSDADCAQRSGKDGDHEQSRLA
jgi:hypothetical protein